VRGDGERYPIYTMEGDVIAAEGDADSHKLSHSLVRKGQITQEQLNAAMTKVTETRPLGEVLVAESYLNQDQLEVLLSEQFSDTLFSSCLVHDGRYQVDSLDAVFAENMQLLFDTVDLLDEARKLRDDLSHLVAALKGSGRGLAKGSAATKVLLTSEQKVILDLVEKHQKLEKVLENSRLDRIPTLKLLIQLLERHVLAIGKVQTDDSEPMGGGRSQRGRDPKAGLFTSQDSVLDKVDLSHVVHFTVATDIPLTGVVETLGVEDLDEREAELESQKTVYMERSSDPDEMEFDDESDEESDERPGAHLTNIEDADDASDELVFSEDGEVSEADDDPTEGIERLDHPIATPSGPAIGLTPAQKQTLRRRVEVYNRMYQTLFAHACQRTRRGEVLGRFQTFFSSADVKFRALYHGLEFRTDGTINPDVVLQNLEKSRLAKPFEFFDQALNDIVSHLLKDAGALISDPAGEMRLREAVIEIRKQLFRKGAIVPPLG